MKIEREIVNLHFNTNHSIVEVQHDTDAAYCLKIIYSRQHNSHPHYSLQRPKQPQIRTHMIPKWRQKTVELARKLPLSQIRASHSECGDAGLNNFFGKLQNFCVEIEKNGGKKNNYKKLWQNVRKWKLFFSIMATRFDHAGLSVLAGYTAFPSVCSHDFWPAGNWLCDWYRLFLRIFCMAAPLRRWMWWYAWVRRCCTQCAREISATNFSSNAFPDPRFSLTLSLIMLKRLWI